MYLLNLLNRNTHPGTRAANPKRIWQPIIWLSLLALLVAAAIVWTAVQVLRQADLALELLDLHRHRWRCQVQCLGGAGHAAVLRDLGKDPQLAETDVHCSALPYPNVKKV